MSIMSAMFRRNPALIAALCLTSAVVARAQTLAPTAARQKAETSEERKNDQQLGLTVGVVGAYDDNLAAQGNGVSDAQTQKSGPHAGLSGGGNYFKRFRFVQIGATEQSTLRYYPTLTARRTAQHALSGGFGINARGTLLQVNQSMSYRPFFSIAQGLTLFSPEVGQIQPGGTFDDAIVTRTAVSRTSTLGGSQTIGRTTSLTGSASYDYTLFREDSTSSTFRSLAAGVSQKVSRNLSLVVGYGNQQGTYHVLGQKDIVVPIHNIDAGVSYSRALGRTRKTTIGFTTGSAMARDTSDNSQFLFIGSARVNREIGRTWHATGAFNRGVNFVAGFPQPFFANTLAVDVAGSASQHVELSFNGGYSNGEMGSSLGRSPSSTNTKSYTSTARIQISLSRTTGISGEYLFYHYAFDGSAALPLGVPSSLHRQGLRFGFDLRLPIIGSRSLRDRTGQ
jgi:hypothetical protein